MKPNRSNTKSITRKTTSVNEQTQLKAVAGRTKQEHIIPTTKRERAADKIQYVLPLGNGWVIKSSKNNNFIAITDSKTEAISIARTLARTKHTMMIVHSKNGTIELKENYLA